MSTPTSNPDFDFNPKRETRRLNPVASPPMGGLGGAVDPAQEVTSLISQLQATAREAHEQVARVERERDELQAQLEEVNARLHSIAARDKDARPSFVEVTAVIRERDELRESVELHQKSIAELQRRIDTMQRQETDLQRQRGALILDRDRAVRERDVEREHHEATLRERDEIRTKTAEVQRQMGPLRQARDSAQSHSRELATKVEHLEDELAEASGERDRLRDEKLELTRELESARERADGLAAEIEQLRAQPAEPVPSGLSSAEREELEARIREQEARAEELAKEAGAARESRDETLNSLTAAQKQIQHIMRDRDEVRERGIQNALELDEEAKAGKDRISALEQQLAEAHRELGVALEKSEAFEHQRLAAIDLAGQLDAAHREIRQLTAGLAEARLETKAALSSSAHPKTPPPLPLNLPPSTPEVGSGMPPPSAAELGEDTLTEKEAKGLLIEIKRCAATFAKSPTDFSLLNELHCHLEHFAERARVSAFIGLHRLAHTLGLLAQDLYRNPERVNPSTLRTISQSIDLLGTLLKQKNYAKLKDPANAHIFAVDDDADNCDTIRLAMECIGMRTRTAQEPAVALAEIASESYDLVFLDVAMPHMDGFELCQHIRSLPNHARTPIVFLTGLTTIENRVQSSLAGGNDFVGKPFNVHELGVKAIALVLKASLHLE